MYTHTNPRTVGKTLGFFFIVVPVALIGLAWLIL